MGKDSVEEKDRKPRRERRHQSSTVADWMKASPMVLQQAIVAAANTGGALRFGYSRDGGAYAVGVYGDGTPYTDFISSAEDPDEYLQEYIQLFADIADDLASGKTGQNGGHKDMTTPKR